MKTSTSLLSVNRLLTSLSTLLLVSFSMFATAKNIKVSLPGNGITVVSGVEYASLLASATDKSVFISWATSSEINNNHFEVEKSTDMKSFKTVAMILDGFNSTGTQTGKTYKFKEAAGVVAEGKTVYYRLKQIDNDNQVHYSAVMSVQINASVIIYPVSTPVSAVAINKINNVENTISTGKILSSKQSAVNAGYINMLVENNFSTGIFA